MWCITPYHDDWTSNLFPDCTSSADSDRVELSSLQLIYALDQPPRQTLGNTRARSSLHANGKPVLGRRQKCENSLLSTYGKVCKLKITQGLMVPTFEHWSHPRKHNQSDFKVHNLFPVCPHECDAGVQRSRTNPKKNIHKVFACIHTGSLVRTNKSYKIILHTVPYFFVPQKTGVRVKMKLGRVGLALRYGSHVTMYRWKAMQRITWWQKINNCSLDPMTEIYGIDSWQHTTSTTWLSQHGNTCGVSLNFSNFAYVNTYMMLEVRQGMTVWSCLIEKLWAYIAVRHPFISYIG